MKDRFLEKIKDIPELDKNDIMNENPLYKNGGVKVHQHHPEFAQSSYLRMRSLEEAFMITNYLETQNS